MNFKVSEKTQFNVAHWHVYDSNHNGQEHDYINLWKWNWSPQKCNKYLVIVDIAGYSLVGYIKCSVLCTQAKCSMNMDMNTVLWNNRSQLENSWITQLFHVFVSVFSAKMCNFVSTSKSVFLYSPVAICKTQTRCM